MPAGYNTSGGDLGFRDDISSSAVGSAAPTSRGSKMSSSFPNAMQAQRGEPARQDQGLGENSNLQNPPQLFLPKKTRSRKSRYRKQKDKERKERKINTLLSSFPNAMQEQRREPSRQDQGLGESSNLNRKNPSPQLFNPKKTRSRKSRFRKQKDKEWKKKETNTLSASNPSGDISLPGYNTSGGDLWFLDGIPSRGSKMGSLVPNATQEQMREPLRQDQGLRESSNLHQQNPTSVNAPDFGTGPRDTDSSIRAGRGILDDAFSNHEV